MSVSEFAGEPSDMTADTDPALDGFRDEIALLREHAAGLGENWMDHAARRHFIAEVFREGRA